jgi:hypothetical protein
MNDQLKLPNHLLGQDDVPFAKTQKQKLQRRSGVALRIFSRRRRRRVLVLITIVCIPQLLQLSGGLPWLHVLIVVAVVIASLDIDIYSARGVKPIRIWTHQKSSPPAHLVQVRHLMKQGQAGNLEEGELFVLLAPRATACAELLASQV